jgi:hypothetical protein
MRQWQKEALRLIRQARVHASRTSDLHLHLMCGRTIEAMIAGGGMVPSELRTYARQIREAYLEQEHQTAELATKAPPE